MPLPPLPPLPPPPPPPPQQPWQPLLGRPSITLAKIVKAINSMPPNNSRIHVLAICAVSLPPLSTMNNASAGPMPIKIAKKAILYNAANNSGVQPPFLASHTYIATAVPSKELAPYAKYPYLPNQGQVNKF